MKLFNVLLILVVFSAGFGIIIYKVQARQQELYELISNKANNDEKGNKASVIIEKIISEQQRSWSALQTKIKNSVVQVFSQVAAVDLLQPYKTPSQFQTTGSGFFVSDKGEIITNEHVIAQAKAVYIQIPSLGKRQIEAEVIGVSPERDLALLKVKDEGLDIIRQELNEIPYLTLGDSDLVHRADEVMTLGYPLGQQGLKSTTGVVSGREQHFIQIDAPINPGNSGGPSLNSSGEVIGINTLYAPDAQNVGYIIPSNELKIIFDDLHKVKLLRKPFLGILYVPATSYITHYLGNPQPGGLYVVDVYKNSPLHKAGIQKRDMIYEINGHKLDIYGDLSWGEDKISIIDYVAQLKLGQDIKLIVYRNGQRKELSVTFDQAELLPIRKIYPGYEKIDYEIIAGMLVQPLNANLLPLLVNIAPGLTRFAEMKYQVEPVLVITHIFPDSQAQRSHAMVPGAIITEINDTKVNTLADLRSAIWKGFETDTITIETTDSVFVAFPFKKSMLDERRLSQDYFYQLSPFIKSIVEKLDQEEVKKVEKLPLSTYAPVQKEL